MHIFVFKTQEAKYILVLSEVMSIPTAHFGSVRNQILIDNTGGCYKGLTKRFFNRKDTMNAMMSMVLLTMAGIV